MVAVGTLPDEAADGGHAGDAADVSQVGTGTPFGLHAECVEVDVRGEWLVAGVDGEDLPTGGGIGGATWMWMSKRPGRMRAGSSMSGRFVVASVTTPRVSSMPSISVRSWLTTRSATPLPVPSPRRGARASISSRNTMQGAAWRAFL